MIKKFIFKLLAPLSKVYNKTLWYSVLAAIILLFPLDLHQIIAILLIFKAIEQL